MFYIRRVGTHSTLTSLRLRLLCVKVGTALTLVLIATPRFFLHIPLACRLAYATSVPLGSAILCDSVLVLIMGVIRTLGLNTHLLVTLDIDLLRGNLQKSLWIKGRLLVRVDLNNL